VSHSPLKGCPEDRRFNLNRRSLERAQSLENERTLASRLSGEN
jgi:hypothetical protein